MLQTFRANGDNFFLFDFNFILMAMLALKVGINNCNIAD